MAYADLRACAGVTNLNRGAAGESREVRWAMTDFEQKVLEELSALKVQMHQLMGIGQPGRLHLLEQRVACNERNLQRMKGVSGAFGGALGLVQLVLVALRSRH